MDISMGIRPEYDKLNHAPGIKAIKEVYQINPAKLSGDPSPEHAQSYQEAYQKHHAKAAKHEAKVLAKYVMKSPVITLKSDVKIEIAKDLIRKHHFHHFPIVDEQDKIIGLLTDRDLLRNSPNQQHRRSEDKVSTDLDAVSNLMSTKLVVAYANTPIADIGRSMLAENIQCVPIVDHEHQVIGIVTSSDFIRCVIEHHEVNAQG